MTCSIKGNHGIIKFSAAESGITLTEARTHFHALTLEQRQAMVEAGERPDEIVSDPNEYLAFLNTQRRHIQQTSHMSPEDKRDALVDIETRISQVESTGRPMPTKATLAALRALPATLAAQSLTNGHNTSAPAAPASTEFSRDTTAEQLINQWRAGTNAQAAAQVENGEASMPTCERCGTPASMARTYSDGRNHYYCPEHGHGLRQSRNWSEMRAVETSDLIYATSAAPTVDAEAALANFLSTPDGTVTSSETPNPAVWASHTDPETGITSTRNQRVVIDPDGTRWLVTADIEPHGADESLTIKVRSLDDSSYPETVVFRSGLQGTEESARRDAENLAGWYEASLATSSLGSMNDRCDNCGRFYSVDGAPHECPAGTATSAFINRALDGFLSPTTATTDPTDDGYDTDWGNEDDMLSNGEWLDDEFDNQFNNEYNDYTPLPADRAIPTVTPPAENPLSRYMRETEELRVNDRWTVGENPAIFSLASRTATNPDTRETVEFNATIVPANDDPNAENGLWVTIRSGDQTINSIFVRRGTDNVYEDARTIAEGLTERFAERIADGTAYRCDACGQFLPIDGSSHACPSRENRWRDGFMTSALSQGETSDDLAFLTHLAGENHPVVSDDGASPEDQIEAYEYLENSTKSMRNSMRVIEEDLINRLNAERINAVVDSDDPNIVASLVGGRVWKDWDTDAVNPAVAARIAPQVGLTEESTESLIASYGTFAQVSRFRAEAMREAGLEPSAFATAEDSPQRLEIRGLEHPQANISTPDLLATRDDLNRSLDLIASADYRASVAQMPLDHAMAEYASLVKGYRWMRSAENAAEDRAVASLSETGEIVEAHPGVTASIHQGRGYRKFDRDAADSLIVAHLARESGHDSTTVSAVVQKYTEFASVTGYRVRAMRAADIPDEAYSHQETPRMRIVLTSADEPAVD